MKNLLNILFPPLFTSLFTILFTVLLSFPVFAQRRASGGGVSVGGGKANAGYAKFAVTTETFTGAKNKSLTGGPESYGGEIGVDAGFNILRYYAKLKVSSSSGSASFLDNNVETKSSFSLLQVNPDLGLAFYPVGRNDRGLNLYFFGGGSFSMNLLELKPIYIVSTGTAATTFTKLQTRQQGFGYGFSGGIGFEIVFGNAKSSKKMIYGEAGVKQTTADLADRSDFQLNSLFFTLGVGL